MVITTAAIAAPTNSNFKTKHAEKHTDGARTKIPRPTPHPPGLARTKTIKVTTLLRPIDAPLPVIRPLVIRKQSAFQKPVIPGTDRLGRASPESAPVSAIRPTRQTSKSSRRSVLVNKNRPGAPPTPQSTPRKRAMLNKALPSKPALRPAHSPERRGVIDATDVNSRNLDALYPPLAPRSSPLTPNSTHLSSTTDSFRVTPSLLSIDQSGGSRAAESAEYGMAQSATIMSFNNPQLLPAQDGAYRNHSDSVDSMHSQHKSPGGFSADSSASKTSRTCYKLNAPGSIEKKAPLQGDESYNGSPIRPSRRCNPDQQRSLPVKLNSNIQTMDRNQQSSPSNPNYVSPSIPSSANFSTMNFKRSSPSTDTIGDRQVLSKAESYADLTIERSPKSSTMGPTNSYGFQGSRRTSKYGYSILESDEARNVIMGGQAGEKSSNKDLKRKLSRFARRTSKNGYIVLGSDDEEKKPSSKDNERKSSRYARRSSKHGSNVPESDEALDAIMDEPEEQKSSDNEGERKTNRSGSRGFIGSQNYSNAPADTHIPPVPKIPASYAAMSPSPSPHLSRMSSSPMNPDYSNGKDSGRATKSNNNSTDAVMTRGVGDPTKSQDPTSKSKAIPDLGGFTKLPRKSHFARQVTPSTARSSVPKKNSKSNGPEPEISQFRSASALSNVSISNGMKRLGRKVAGIIPGRRTAKTSVASHSMVELSDVSPSVSGAGRPRRTSRLLTTYKNSGMNDATSSRDVSIKSPIRGEASFGEPTDKHETNEATCDKDEWDIAQQGLVYEGNHLLHFAPPPTGQGVPNGDGDDDEPPNNPPVQDNHNGHYVERTEEEPPQSATTEVTAVDESVQPRLSMSGAAVSPGAPDSPGGLNPNTVLQMTNVINEAREIIRALMDRIVGLEPGPFRIQVANAVSALEALVICLQDARILSVRVDQTLNELTVTIANGGARLSALVEAYLAERG